MAKHRSARRSARATTPKFLPGARATLAWGMSPMAVEVLEDRGPVGYRGQHLVLVRTTDRDSLEGTFEVAAEDLRNLRPPPKEKRRRTRSASAA